MEKFFSENLIYPQDAREKQISGSVELGLMISKLGYIEKISISKSIYTSVDDEALRLVKSLPRWTPGFYQDDLLSKYEKIQVNFNLK